MIRRSATARRRSACHRAVGRRAARLVAVAITACAVREASAVVYTFSNPDGGGINVSTNFTPVGTPGSTDTLQIDDLPRIFTNTTLTVPVNQAVAGIQYSHYGQTSINGPGTLTLQNGTLAFDDAITALPDAPLNSLFLNANIAGAAGLTKTGPGFALLSGNNSYTGGTTIVGNGNTTLASRRGLSVLSDSGLGAAGAGITLDNGGTLRTLSSFTSTRSISVATSANSIQGGYIESLGGILTLNGPITIEDGTLGLGRFGSGSITIGGTISPFMTFNGPVIIGDRADVNLLGQIATSVVNAGTFTLGQGTTGPSSNALSDGGSYSSFGGRLNLIARATTSSESVGTVGLVGGTSVINLEPTVNAGVNLAFVSLARSARGTLFVRGRELGVGTSAVNRALITLGGTVSAIGGSGTTATNDSIVPFIVGNANVTGGVSQVSVVEAGLVTNTANGLRPLDSSDYAVTIGAAANDNVRISDGVFTQNSAATVNALVIRDTLASSGNTGIVGSGALTITSGAIAAVSDLTGEELFIDNPVSFGAAEGIVHVLPTADGDSSLTMRGAISGSNGLTKSGNGDLYLTSTASTYTGDTTLNGGSTIVSGNVFSGQPSALGTGTSPIALSGGANDNVPTAFLAGSPDATIARDITIKSSAPVTIGSAGSGIGATFSGTIIFGDRPLPNTADQYLTILANDDPDHVLTLSGNIQGYGFLQDPAVVFPAFQIVRLTGNNAAFLNVIIRGGEWQAGSDTALGGNSIYFAGNNTAEPTGGISASGGARTLTNYLYMRAAPVFSGSNPLTFTGPVDLGSVNREIYTTNTADTTLTGVVSRGGVIKRGDGRLVMSGNNSYNGQTIVFEGALRAASNNALGVAAGNVNPNQGTFIIGTGSLELAGGITTAEAIYLGSGSVPINGANAQGNLRSVSGSNTITESIAFDNVGTVGVDAGSTLTLQGETLDNTVNTTAALRKVGAGTLAIKNVRLNTLDVQAGTVRITPSTSVITTSASTNRVSNLSVAAGALLDLSNTSLIYDYDTTSPLAAVRTLLQQGRIDTTSGGVNGAVGYFEASGFFPAGTFPQQYGGLTFDNTTLLLTYTIAGDATLNKTVDFDDLLILAKNFNGTNKVWMQGDFNYDAAVNFDDLLLLAKAFNQTAPANSAAAVLALSDESFAAQWSLAQSLVPEPATLAAAALLVPLARRRR